MEDNVKTKENVKPEASPSLLQAESEPSQVSQGSSKKLWYAGGIIFALLVVGGLYMLFQKPSPSLTQPAIQSPTATPKLTSPRSKAPGTIASVSTASSLDMKGNALTPVSTFAKTDKNIYLVLALNKPKVGTKIEYIRYLNKKLLDNNAVKLVKPNLTTMSFAWSLKKPDATHIVGSYRVKIYSNGILEKEISYSVR